jgi:ubiquinone/menaquinone biosynthesis C-methylase UbiE
MTYNETLREAVTNRTASQPEAGGGGRAAQQLVNQKFDAEAGKWRDLYQLDSVYARVIQHRQSLALDWVAQVVGARARALEVGCGAGFLAAELASRGLTVYAIDSVPKMVQLTEERLSARGLSAIATAAVGDANHIDAPDASFDLVTALGVIDWVPSASGALGEMARVLRPGGHLICSAGHPAALAFLLDPLKNAALAPALRAVKQALEAVGLRKPRSGQRFYRIAVMDRLIAQAGLEKLDGRTVGFGPLTVFRRPFLPEPAAQRIQASLQQLADAKVPILAQAGMGYMVLARRNGAAPGAGPRT